MKIKPFYRWYDLWIGAFYDRRKQRLYLCCLGFGVWFEKEKNYTEIPFSRIFRREPERRFDTHSKLWGE